MTTKKLEKLIIKKMPAYYNMRVLCLSTIIVLLAATSVYLFFEEQRLEEQVANIFHEREMLDAEVPDPVIKYAPLLVDANDPQIKELAASLGGPEEIYLFVRDKIEYSEEFDKRRIAIEVLNSKKGDCLGQADLLASLLIAHGYTDKEVFVGMGHVTRDGIRRHHAWVELNNKGKWIVLDASQFLGTFEFDRWDRESFYEAYHATPHVEFNDGYAYINFNDMYAHAELGSK